MEKTAKQKLNVSYPRALVHCERLAKPLYKKYSWIFILKTSPGSIQLSRSVISGERCYEIAWRKMTNVKSRMTPRA